MIHADELQLKNYRKEVKNLGFCDRIILSSGNTLLITESLVKSDTKFPIKDYEICTFFL